MQTAGLRVSFRCFSFNDQGSGGTMERFGLKVKFLKIYGVSLYVEDLGSRLGGSALRFSEGRNSAKAFEIVSCRFGQL